MTHWTRLFLKKNISTFYTSVDPKDYYNEKGKPIAVKAYSAVGPSTSKDETTTTSSGVKQRTIIQTIKLPNSLGDHIFNKYKEEQRVLSRLLKAFIKNVLKGSLHSLYSWRRNHFIH
ncbi:MAG: hypothetical protein ACLUVG_10350 [Phocaeicola vulgatus]